MAIVEVLQGNIGEGIRLQKKQFPGEKRRDIVSSQIGIGFF